MNHIYACIDLKSFYASVECIKRNLDPLKTNLVVADSSRTEKTICLAVSPSLKQYKIPGRARLYEVVEKVKEINKNRKEKISGKIFIGSSYLDDELKQNKNLSLDYIIAPPHMKDYLIYSTQIYNVYLKYLSPDDIYVYSIDEIFCDITHYLKTYKLSPEKLITKIINDIYKTTGITATAGIGTNLYLAKVAMDIVAKHQQPNEFGVRVACLNESLYRKYLWTHIPITDFWRVGKGYQKKLQENNMYTMGDICLKSIEDEDLLYKLFGVNAELLIDHAWGYEPCTIKDIKNYKPQNSSISSGQVLQCAYPYEKAKIVVREMADQLSIDLTNKSLTTNKLTLTIGYDIANIKKGYTGPVKEDMYKRLVPKPAHGTINLDKKTSRTSTICDKAIELFDKIIDKSLLIKRINIAAVTTKNKNKKEQNIEQCNLFTNYEKIEEEEKENLEKEQENKKLQNTIIDIKNKYGKNSLFKGTDLEEGATTFMRNNQIGGHQQ